MGNTVLMNFMFVVCRQKHEFQFRRDRPSSGFGLRGLRFAFLAFPFACSVSKTVLIHPLSWSCRGSPPNIFAPNDVCLSFGGRIITELPLDVFSKCS